MRDPVLMACVAEVVQGFDGDGDTADGREKPAFERAETADDQFHFIGAPFAPGHDIGIADCGFNVMFKFAGLMKRVFQEIRGPVFGGNDGCKQVACSF